MFSQTGITGYLIDGGPSREELFDQVRLSNEYRGLEFTFMVAREHGGQQLIGQRFTAKARISMIGPESGNGRMWIIEARLDGDLEGYELNELGLVRFFYNSTTRQGRVIEGRPYTHRFRVDKENRLWRGTYYVGNVIDLMNKASTAPLS